MSNYFPSDPFITVSYLFTALVFCFIEPYLQYLGKVSNSEDKAGNRGRFIRVAVSRSIFFTIFPILSTLLVNWLFSML